jgi:GTPase SAR1 family protein
MRCTDSSFDSERLSTIGIDFKKKIVKYEGEDIHLQIWDTAGQERFHTITAGIWSYVGSQPLPYSSFAAYYRGIDAVMLVYDVTQRLSFTHITKWVKDVESKSQSKVGMVLVANKSDLQDARAVTPEEGQHLAREYGIDFFEASAKTGVNVNEAFERLVDICMVCC